MPTKTDYLDLVIDLNQADGRTFEAPFAFSGKDAVGVNRLYLPASKYADFAGQAILLRRSHNDKTAPIGVAKIEMRSGGKVAVAVGEVFDTAAGNDYLNRAEHHVALRQGAIRQHHQPLRRGQRALRQEPGPGGQARGARSGNTTSRWSLRSAWWTRATSRGRGLSLNELMAELEPEPNVEQAVGETTEAQVRATLATINRWRNPA